MRDLHQMRRINGGVSNYESLEAIDPNGKDGFVIDSGLKSLF